MVEETSCNGTAVDVSRIERKLSDITGTKTLSISVFFATVCVFHLSGMCSVVYVIYICICTFW